MSAVVYCPFIGRARNNLPSQLSALLGGDCPVHSLRTSENIFVAEFG